MLIHCPMWENLLTKRYFVLYLAVSPRDIGEITRPNPSVSYFVSQPKQTHEEEKHSSAGHFSRHIDSEYILYIYIIYIYIYQ